MLCQVEDKLFFSFIIGSTFKIHCRGIDTKTFAGVGRTVGEDMSEMAAAVGAGYFGADHAVA